MEEWSQLTNLYFYYYINLYHKFSVKTWKIRIVFLKKSTVKEEGLPLEQVLNFEFDFKLLTIIY